MTDINCSVKDVNCQSTKYNRFITDLYDLIDFTIYGFSRVIDDDTENYFHEQSFQHFQHTMTSDSRVVFM